MRLWYGSTPLVAEWVRRQIPHMDGGDFGPCEAIGIINNDGEILGGVVFHGMVGRTIQWSAAAKTANWLRPDLIADIMDYPFKQLGCVRITAFIPRRNKRARDFHVRFGFKHEGTMRRQFGGDDAAIYGLLAADWRRSPFNTESKRSAPETLERMLEVGNA